MTNTHKVTHGSAHQSLDRDAASRPAPGGNLVNRLASTVEVFDATHRHDTGVMRPIRDGSRCFPKRAEARCYVGMEDGSRQGAPAARFAAGAYGTAVSQKSDQPQVTHDRHSAKSSEQSARRDPPVFAATGKILENLRLRGRSHRPRVTYVLVGRQPLSTSYLKQCVRQLS